MLDDLKRKYCKEDSPPPEDTTARGARKLLTPGFLRFVGELLFGERWQTPLAQSLGAARGKRLAPATVHQWSTRTRSIPDWVAEALALALDHGQRELSERAGMARSVATRIRNPRSSEYLDGQDEEEPDRNCEAPFDQDYRQGLRRQEEGRDTTA
jgi:hypothetical protein